MDKLTSRVSAIATLVSLFVAVASSLVLWMILSKSNQASSFLLFERGVWVLVHVTSSVVLTTSLLYHLVVNWRGVKKFLLDGKRPAQASSEVKAEPSLREQPSD